MRQPKEVIINGKTLEEILTNHMYWVNSGSVEELENKMRADLSNVDLSYVDLHCTNLSNANLSGANLSNAELRDADLSTANLSYANLSDACLRGANLSDADLHGANLSHTMFYCADLRNVNLSSSDLHDAKMIGSDLSYTNLSHVDLSDAILRRTNLTNANLYGANLTNTFLTGSNLIGANFINNKGDLIEYRKGKILTEDIVGYKKCRNDIIVTLQIPKGAIVFSINGNKCRTNKVKVIAIDGAKIACSIFDDAVEYKVGKEIDIQDFNCEYNEECAEGIHFFMTREKAEKYNL